MQPKAPLDNIEESDVVESSNQCEEVFFGDADFAKATLEGRAAFAEGQETILLEELRAEIA